MEKTAFTNIPSLVVQQDTHDCIDLDIRVIEHIQPLIDGLVQGSDYLTCKTDSTCDGSNAC